MDLKKAIKGECGRIRLLWHYLFQHREWVQWSNRFITLVLCRINGIGVGTQQGDSGL